MTRYLVGVGGLVWAMVTDHLDPILLMILGAVATSTDVLLFAKDLIKVAKEESQDLARERERSADSPERKESAE